MKLSDLILKHILKNAHDFGGKVNPKAAMGQIIRENPNFKKDIPALLKEIEQTAKEVEKLSLT